MKETQLATKYKKLISDKLPGAWYHKLPDTGSLGGKKPFDAILVYWGLAYAIEYKVSKRKLTKYQQYQKKTFPGPFLIVTEHTDPDWFIEQIKNIARGKGVISSGE